ncbi:tetraacyldisaccharide 4'-kinase, partial [Mycobacterium tuberculosis]|nr:tetraacyldisaccharide 4'-kinase [Mycobacterium tuberculosis]
RERPAIVSRGYGGSAVGPHRVTAADPPELVGDEALLGLDVAPTIVARDRAAGTALAADDGATVALFDDGFQNPRVEKRLCFVVVDAGYGIGNG